MKTKIEIKTVFGEVLFEYEKEDNTIKDTLQEAVKNGADLCSANLRGAALCSADFYCANLRGVDLRGADLCGADLRGANLYGADLSDTNLVGADLCGADLSGTCLCDIDLRGANLRGADLCGAYLGSWGNLKDTSDILIVGTIGSRDSYTTIYHTDKGVFVQCGCFSGTLGEFVAKVKETHKGNKHERDYLALVEFAKIKFGL